MGHEKLSDQLRRLIAQCGISRYEIFKRTGIDQGGMSNFMAGRRGIQLDNIDKIGKVLNLKLMQVGRPKAKKGRAKRPRSQG